jgi:hypothetical protein
MGFMHFVMEAKFWVFLLDQIHRENFKQRFASVLLSGTLSFLRSAYWNYFVLCVCQKNNSVMAAFH